MKELALHETSGWSMAPFLRSGDKIILRACPARELRLGSLVVYRATAILICHRLVFKTESHGVCRLFVRGDASWSWPEMVPGDSVAGVVAAVARRSGGISLMDRWNWRLFNFAMVFLSPLTALAYAAANALRRRIAPWRAGADANGQDRADC